MGNSWGNVPSNTVNLYLHPEVTPSPEEEPTFDPLLGFPNGRKTREMILSKEVMESVKMPLKDRDYCADKLLDYTVCRTENFPFIINCAHQKHAYLNCKYDDFIIRMKEYERERRLRVKKQQKLQSLAHEQQSITA